MSQVPQSPGSPYVSAPSAGGAGSTPGSVPAPNGYGGAPAYGTPPPAVGAPAYGGTPPAPKGRTGPLILTLVGVALLVGAIIAFTVSIVSVIGLADSLNQIEANGSVTATLESGQRYGLYTDGLVECRVTGPDGQDVPVENPAERTEVNDVDLSSTFTADGSGDYTVTCSSPSNNPVFLGKAIDVGSVMGGAIGIIMSIVGGVVGLIVLVAGLIWLGVRNSSNKRAQAAQTFGGSQPYTGQSW